MGMLSEDKKKYIITMALAATILLPLCSAEITGTINLTGSNYSIATGLWGETLLTTTTTTTVVSTTTTSLQIQTGSSATTTTTTTTTVAGATTTTAAGTTSHTTTTAPIYFYSNDNCETNRTSEDIKSVVEASQNLSAKIAEISGKDIYSAIDFVFSEVLNNGQTITIRKDLMVKGNVSELKLNIQYNGEQTISQIMIYDIVPKGFASNASDIEVQTSLETSVVENDPAFLFTAPSVAKDEILFVKYIVNRTVASDIVNQGDVVILAQGYEKAFSAFNTWMFVIVAIVVIFLLIFALLKDEILEITGLRRQGPYKYRKPAEIIKARLVEIKDIINEKILKKRKHIKIIYKYHYNPKKSMSSPDKPQPKPKKGKTKQEKPDFRPKKK